MPGTGEGGRSDLERGGQGSIRLARGEVAGGEFAVCFVELGLHLIGQFEAIFDAPLVPRVKLFQLRPGELGDGRFNFLNCAYGGKTPNPRPFAKPGFPIPFRDA